MEDLTHNNLKKIKKTLLIIITLVLHHNSFSQKKNYDVFKSEFMRSNYFPNNKSNNFYIALLDRSIYKKVDSIKYNFLNQKNIKLIKVNYDYASDFFRDRSNIIIDSISGLLYKNKTQILFSNFEGTHWYDGDLGLAYKNNKSGFINKKGKIIIPFIYEDAYPFFEEYASVKKDKKWFYINKNGEKILPDSLTYSYRPIINSHAIFMSNTPSEKRKNRLINNTQSVLEFLNKIEKIELKEGLINVNGKIIIKPIYDEISGYFHKGYMRVQNNGLLGIIDENGKIVIPLNYERISDISNEKLFVVRKREKYGMVDINNKIIIPIEYDLIKAFSDKKALVKINDKASYINKKNEIVIKTDYDFHSMGNFINNIAIVKKNNKYGYIDLSGNEIIPLIYDNALPFYKNKTIVQKDNKYYYIDKRGKVLMEAKKLWLEKEKLIRFKN